MCVCVHARACVCAHACMHMSRLVVQNPLAIWHDSHTNVSIVQFQVDQAQSLQFCQMHSVVNSWGNLTDHDPACCLAMEQMSSGSGVGRHFWMGGLLPMNKGHVVADNVCRVKCGKKFAK